MLRAFLVLLITLTIICLAKAQSDQEIRDLSLEDAFLSTDQGASLDADRPKYNNYAMTCVDSKETTLSCQREPYKYYCDSKGNLKFTKRETAYCDWCDCIDLFPKPACIINLIGQSNCARSLSNGTDRKAIDNIDRAQAVKKEQLRIVESTEADLSVMLAGMAPRTSSASRPGLRTWIKKLSTGFSVFNSSIVPNGNQVETCNVGDNLMNHSCGLDKRGSMGKK